MLDVLHLSSDLRRLSGGLSAPLITAVLLVAAITVILAALAFQHIGGYTPCPLCLQQRYAYYLGIPALAGALALMLAGRPKVAAGILAAVALAFVFNAGLGGYQAGAEWKFWEPPTTCAGSGELPTFDLKTMNLDRMPASCGVASWRFLGLSFAGWNAFFSAGLAAGAALGVLKAVRRSD
jgi:disulfide bond formation protein DsbB